MDKDPYMAVTLAEHLTVQLTLPTPTLNNENVWYLFDLHWEDTFQSMIVYCFTSHLHKDLDVTIDYKVFQNSYMCGIYKKRRLDGQHITNQIFLKF